MSPAPPATGSGSGGPAPVEDPWGVPSVVHLRAGGTSLLLATDRGLLPRVLHWGSDLGELSVDDTEALAVAAAPPTGHDPTDVVLDATVLPEHAAGWTGRPGVEGSRDGRDRSPALRVVQQRLSTDEHGGQRLVVRAADPVAALSAVLELEMTPSGLVRARAALTNDGAPGTAAYRVDALRVVLPVPAEADELLDLTGRRVSERVPQRTPFSCGLHAREVRTGRTGLDPAHVLAAGRRGSTSRRGEVWAVHLDRSGDQVVHAEHLPDGTRVLGGGELLPPGEVDLAPGDTCCGPWLHALHGDGLDDVAARSHRYLRARPQHPS